MSAVLESTASKAPTLTVVPLEPTIGAEISGIDLRQPLTIEQRDEIKALLLKHRVIFFRDQPIDHEQQLSFARQFGKIYQHPITRQADSRIDTTTGDSHRISQEEARRFVRKREGAGKTGFHTDTSWLVRPTWGAVLRSIDVPPAGGDTIWADGHLVYEALDEETKELVKDLYVVHDFQYTLQKVNLDYPIVSHKLVQVHPETGEKIVWVNFGQKPSVIGWDKAASDALIDKLQRLYYRPEFHVRFKWTKNAVAFWDNRAGLHTGISNYGDYPRQLERVLIEDFDALPHY